MPGLAISVRAGAAMAATVGLVIGAGLWLWSIAGGEVHAAMLLGAVLRCF